MNCISCGQVLPRSNDPTARFLTCDKCGTDNDLAAVEEHTQAVRTVRPQLRRSALRSLVGKTLGDGMYRIDSEVGGGGMAKVYLAIQLRLDRKVAVKVLPQELLEDPSFVQRFRREATVLAKFSHANIVPVFDTGEEDGIHYIVMGYIEGPGGKASTLRDLLDAGPLEVDHAMRIMEQCLSALQYAHEKAIIHRDIKPGNILMDERGGAHLADFGIASSGRGSGTGDPTLTVSGSTLGTARYMAPEQKEDASQADARSDIYSMGLLFFETLIGYVPEATTFLPGNLLTSKKQSKTFVLPSTAKPGLVDERVDGIILRAIQPDPADRYQSVGEMLADLRAAMGGAQFGAPRRRKPAKPRSRAMMAAVAVIIIGALGFGGLYYSRMRTRIPSDMLAALKSGDNEEVISILKKQPDVITRTDEAGLTPLHHAAAQNLSSAARELIGSGAKLEVQDFKGRTPLHHAALSNRPALVVLLLEKGAREVAQDNDSKTPYQLASENKQKEATLVFERSDLIAAISKNDRPSINRLVTEDLAMSASEEGWTALHYAAYKGDEFTTEKLLEKGALVDAQTGKDYESGVRYEAGRTPLLLACEFSKEVGKYANVVEQLLSKKASVDLADAKGRTALHYAAMNGDIKIASLLIAKTVPNAKTNDSLTPLHFAAQSGSLDVLNLLLANRADPALADAKGQTALHLAAAKGHVDLVKVLLKREELTNEVRVAARKAAEDAKQPAAVAVFDEWRSDKLFSTIETGRQTSQQVKTVEELLAWPVPHPAATVRAADGRSPLGVAVAATQPSVELVEAIHAAEPEMATKPDASGESPLYAATSRAQVQIVAMLAKKCDPKTLDSTDASGRRLLNAAVASGDPAVVKLLIETYRVGVDTADANRVTPLQLAAGNFDVGMVQTLLQAGAKPDMAALDAAAKALKGRTTEDARAETLSIVGGAILAAQLDDAKTTKTRLAATFSKFDAIPLQLLARPLPNGKLPLQTAIERGSPETKHLLIEKAKAQKLLDAGNPATGETALHLAAAQGQSDIVQSLLAAGASYTIRNAAGKTPEESATLANQAAVAKLLKDRRGLAETKVATESKAISDAQAAAKAAIEAKELAAAEAEKAATASSLGDASAAKVAAAAAMEKAKTAAATAAALATKYPKLAVISEATKSATDAKSAADKSALAAKDSADKFAANEADNLRLAEKRESDARSARAWFDDLFKNSRLVAINGIGDLQTGRSITKKGASIEGIGYVECTLSGGLMKIVPLDENRRIPSLQPASEERITRPSGNEIVAGYENQPIRNKDREIIGYQKVAIMVPDGKTVTYSRFSYVGRVVTKPNGAWAWEVNQKDGMKSFPMEVRPKKR